MVSRMPGTPRQRRGRRRCRELAFTVDIVEPIVKKVGYWEALRQGVGSATRRADPRSGRGAVRSSRYCAGKDQNPWPEGDLCPLFSSCDPDA